MCFVPAFVSRIIKIIPDRNIFSEVGTFIGTFNRYERRSSENEYAVSDLRSLCPILSWTRIVFIPSAQEKTLTCMMVGR